MNKLLTRNEFRNQVFDRDSDKCVICKEIGQDAHHIVERRLWSDGGYYVDNGAVVCGECHIRCESTEISVEQVREAAGIKTKRLPEQFYDDDIIDKWGNYILPNGQRVRGELFYDESVQKIIADKLSLFTKYIKHPRTPHIWWSESVSDDDMTLANSLQFEGKCVIVHEKMDGENTTLYKDYFHARSIDSNNHPSRNRAKAYWAGICSELPEGYRFVVENMYAKHSISYDALEDYLYGLFVWDDKNICLSREETELWFHLLGLPTPNVLYHGIYDEDKIRSIKLDTEKQEGYVIRTTDSFSYSQFKYNVAKYVRANHVQTKHWNCMQIIPNKLGNQ